MIACDLAQNKMYSRFTSIFCFIFCLHIRLFKFVLIWILFDPFTSHIDTRIWIFIQLLFFALSRTEFDLFGCQAVLKNNCFCDMLVQIIIIIILFFHLLLLYSLFRLCYTSFVFVARSTKNQSKLHFTL